MIKQIINAKIVLEDRVVNGSLFIQDGKILGVNIDNCIADQVVDANGGYVLPGFIDIHVHGGGGADFMDGSVEDFVTATNAHLGHGTTTIYPTTMSAEFSEIVNVFDVYRAAKKCEKIKINLGGLHLEGPFISPKMCGAQRLDLIIEPNKEIISVLEENSDIIARISCAPEVNGVYDMASALIKKGVQFSMGHTNATYEQAEEATKKGFTSITHMYSATSGFHKVNQKVHIGVTQAGYGIDELYPELIGDGCHVPKELLRLVTRFKGFDKVCLVTDAMRAAGTDLTESYLGKICPENRVIIDDGVAKLPDKSFFAGSIGTMDRALKFAVKNAAIKVEDAIKLVSLTPAKLMKIDDKKGSIESGKDADLVITDNDFVVKTVFVGGNVVVNNA